MNILLAILALQSAGGFTQELDTLRIQLFDQKVVFDSAKTWETRGQTFSEFNQLVNRYILQAIRDYTAGDMTASNAALAVNWPLIMQARMSSVASRNAQSLFLYEYANQLVLGTPYELNNLIALERICINKRDTHTLVNKIKFELARLNQWPEHNSFYDQIANLINIALTHLEQSDKGRDFFRMVERFFEKMQAENFYSSSLSEAFLKYLDRVESFPGNWAPPKRREFEVWLTARAELGPTDVFAHMENRMPETTAMLEANWKAFLKKYSEPVQKPQ